MNKLSHIGIAVKSSEESTKIFSCLFNKNPIKIETVEEQKVRVVFFQVGEISIEITEATSHESPIAKFIEKRGEGVHHLAFEVVDIYSEINRLVENGFQIIDEKPRIGAGGHLIAFLHPKSTNGVLMELTQKVK